MDQLENDGFKQTSALRSTDVCALTRRTMVRHLHTL